MKRKGGLPDGGRKVEAKGGLPYMMKRIMRIMRMMMGGAKVKRGKRFGACFRADGPGADGR
jgi:hypothetical protein